MSEFARGGYVAGPGAVLMWPSQACGQVIPAAKIPPGYAAELLRRLNTPLLWEGDQA